MTSAGALLEALDPTGISGDGRFSIRLAVDGAFVARSPGGRACLLVPTRIDARAPGRVSGRLELTFQPRLCFDVGGRRWDAPCAVVECLDEGLLPVFCALSLDVAQRLTRGGTPPTPPDVAAALAEWERLLRSTRRLTEAEELGLWGELTLISLAPNADAAVRAWCGPTGAAVDFHANGVAIECKTSRERLRHQISHDQVGGPLGNVPVFVASLWAGADPSGGRTVAELVADIGARTTEAVAFERALLTAGYSRAEASHYTARFTLLEAPQWFEEPSVPRVRAVDPGVTHVRYVAQLDEACALDEPAAARLLAWLTGRGY